MSRTPEIIADIILQASRGRRSSAESYHRTKALLDGGAILNKDLQAWELNGRRMSVEMATFGSLSALASFINPNEKDQRNVNEKA